MMKMMCFMASRIEDDAEYVAGLRLVHALCMCKVQRACHLHKNMAYRLRIYKPRWHRFYRSAFGWRRIEWPVAEEFPSAVN